MENLKHTKGEWFVELASVQTEKRLIANCIGNGASITEEDKANSRLIASAPDLLDALIEAKEQIEHLAWKLNKDGSDFAKVTTKETLEIVNEAINKAIK